MCMTGFYYKLFNGHSTGTLCKVLSSVSVHLALLPIRSIRLGKSGFAVTTQPASLVLGLLLAVCALLSKEHGATVLGVFVAYDVMVTSRQGIDRYECVCVCFCG